MIRAEESSMIRKMEQRDADDVAKIYIEAIDTGFISNLGLKFVSRLHKEIAKSDTGFGYVWVENGKVMGFITGCTDILKLYKSIIKKWIYFLFPLLKHITEFLTIKKMLQTMFYPAKVKDTYGKAEILAVGLKEEYEGKGIGLELMGRILEEFKKRGIKRVKVLAYDKNVVANNYYVKAGFEPAGKIKHHENFLNVYLMNLES